MDSSEGEGLFITQSSTKVKSCNVCTFLSVLILYRLLKVAFLFFLIEQRFRTPITASECEKFESLVSDSSRRKWAWVLKVFEKRKKQRNKAVLKEDYSSESIIHEDIDEMSHEKLDFTLASFVAEVRKEDGQDYPGK